MMMKLRKGLSLLTFQPCRSSKRRKNMEEKDLLQKTASVDSTLERKMQLFETTSTTPTTTTHKAKISYTCPLLMEMANAESTTWMEKAVTSPISPQNSNHNLFLGTVEEADDETEASSSSGDEMDEPPRTKKTQEAFQTTTTTMNSTSSVCSANNQKLSSNPSNEELTERSCCADTTTAGSVQESHQSVVKSVKDNDEDEDNETAASHTKSVSSAVVMEHPNMEPDETTDANDESEQNQTIAKNESNKSLDETSTVGSVTTRKSVKSVHSMAGSVATRKSLKSILLSRKNSTAGSVASLQDSVALAHKRCQVPVVHGDNEIVTTADTLVKNESMTSHKHTSDYISMVRKVSICDEATILGHESKEEEEEEEEDTIIDVNDDAEDATIETSISRQDSMAAESICSKKSILSRRSTSSRRSVRSASRPIPLSRVCKSMPIIPVARKGSKIGSLVTRFSTARNTPSDPSHALSPVAEEGSKGKEATSSESVGKTDSTSVQSRATEMVVGSPAEDQNSPTLEIEESRTDFSQKNNDLLDEAITIDTAASRPSTMSQPLDVEEIKQEILLTRKDSSAASVKNMLLEGDDSTASLRNKGSLAEAHNHERRKILREKSLLDDDERSETKSAASIRRKKSRDAASLTSPSSQSIRESASIGSQKHSRITRVESEIEPKPHEQNDQEAERQSISGDKSTAQSVTTPKQTNTETAHDLESQKKFHFFRKFGGRY